MATKKKRPAKEHPCIAKIDALLAKQGDQLQKIVRLDGSPQRIYVATERADAQSWRRGSSWLQASFCPFCGKEMTR